MGRSLVFLCGLWILNSTGFTSTTRRLNASSSPTVQDAPVALRLAQGGHVCAGLVELYYKEAWSPVCDDGWNRINAEVVCRQAGCGSPILPLARYGRGSGNIIMDDVSCAGTEQTLWQCLHRGWYVHDCGPLENVGVICSANSNFSAPQPQIFPVELRLADGWHRCAGRVEINYNNSWGTVCDDLWDINDAMVVCRQLDCGTAVSAYGLAHFGEGIGNIVLDDVSCVGTETALSQCPHRPWGTHNCVHGEDSGVICTGAGFQTKKSLEPPSTTAKQNVTEIPLNLRLVNGSHHCKGRLEVLYQGVWGTVCDDLWGLSSAVVVCRQLGCGRELQAPPLAFFGRGSGSILLDDVNCVGTESFLWTCPHRPWRVHNCDHSEDASVMCALG
ncbi:scavenger receptor cysteine-rich domain-containing protein DMBT1 [Ranitomeya imitator]|uniref:scavenger receptor cysteine-rich domain-containing protein DMBT1 n=1 Tax=Ranitomeya imitator TaxID=111125 RepID=UPI0037E7F0C7